LLGRGVFRPPLYSLRVKVDILGWEDLLPRNIRYWVSNVMSSAKSWHYHNMLWGTVIYCLSKYQAATSTVVTTKWVVVFPEIFLKVWTKTVYPKVPTLYQSLSMNLPLLLFTAESKIPLKLFLTTEHWASALSWHYHIMPRDCQVLSLEIPSCNFRTASHCATCYKNFMGLRPLKSP
jgi:hypothetical protein